MKLFGLSITRAAKVETRGTLTDPDEKIRAALGGMPAISGVTVSEENAMAVAAVYACVRVLAETVAQLPLKVFRRTSKGMVEAPEHPVFNLLKAEPNEWQTSLELREMQQGSTALRGNSYCYVRRNASFEPIALIPLVTSKVEVLPLPYKGAPIPTGVLYRYCGMVFNRWDILHIRGLTTDGFEGVSPVRTLKETFGMPAALEKTTAGLLGNGVRPAGVLEHPAELGDEAAKRLRDQFNSMYAGAANTGRTVVLEEGMKFNSIGMTFEDAEILASKRFSVEEIARIFRVPLHMIQSTDKTTSWGTGLEQMTLGFLQYTMQPWLKRWEESCDAVLLREDEKGIFNVKFDLRGIMRGDHKSRMEAYAIGLLNGVYNIDECREWENLPEIPDGKGKDHRIPLNTAPVGEEPKPAAQPTNEPGKPPAEGDPEDET